MKVMCKLLLQNNRYSNHRKKYKKIQTTRKQSCPAKIVIKELLYFLDFSVRITGLVVLVEFG